MGAWARRWKVVRGIEYDRFEAVQALREAIRCREMARGRRVEG